MKSSASPRRPVRKQQVRLDLRRAAPPPPPEDEVESRKNKNFWGWFTVVALFHVLLLIGIAIFFHDRPAPPPEQVISLEPLGQTVQGTPGQQSAPKVGSTTSAPAHHHHHSHPMIPVPPPQPVTPPPPTPTPTPPSPPQAVKPPPPPTPTPAPTANPTPVIKQIAPTPPKVAKAQPKPVKPKKLKVSLKLVDDPNDVTPPDKPAPKHVKKPRPVILGDDQPDTDDSRNSDDNGLSKEQIAAQLGKKLEHSGIRDSKNVGASGSAGGQDSPFKDFYLSIAQQIEDKYQKPEQDDQQAVDPQIHIYVEPDGRVPVDRVTLVRSSGNPAIDDAVLSATKAIGYTLQPLPQGCNPDISINFKLHN